MKNILIISNFFYPELTPRAFRVHELIKEFTKLGHKVTLVLPNKEIYHNNKVNIEGLNIIYSNSKKIIDGSNKNPLDIIIHNNKIRFFIMKIGKFFFPKEIFLTYDSGITNVFKSINNEFDILISISQPLSIHLSVIFGLLSNKKLRKTPVKYAEFSDP